MNKNALLRSYLNRSNGVESLVETNNCLKVLEVGPIHKIKFVVNHLSLLLELQSETTAWGLTSAPCREGGRLIWRSGVFLMIQKPSFCGHQTGLGSQHFICDKQKDMDTLCITTCKISTILIEKNNISVGFKW